jgi:hypothetical protein
MVDYLTIERNKVEQGSANYNSQAKSDPQLVVGLGSELRA